MYSRRSKGRHDMFVTVTAITTTTMKKMVHSTTVLLILLFVLPNIQHQTTLTTTTVVALQSFTFPKFTNIIDTFKLPNLLSSLPNTNVNNNKRLLTAKEIETQLIQLINDNDNSNSNKLELQIQQLITILENDYKDISIPNPAISNTIYGRWKLIYSTKPTTASPIQRTAFNKKSSFPIYQDIIVVDSISNENNNKKSLQVNQVIDFKNDCYLSIDAIASTTQYPLQEILQPRKGSGTILGINILGVSVVGTTATELRTQYGGNNSIIDFIFDSGNFILNKYNITIPYPVPFRLPILRDTVKGWIAITYLSPFFTTTDSTNDNKNSQKTNQQLQQLRISRGNKGTAFVLQKVS